jgi:hypothetical protein
MQCWEEWEKGLHIDGPGGCEEEGAGERREGGREGGRKKVVAFGEFVSVDVGALGEVEDEEEGGGRGGGGGGGGGWRKRYILVGVVDLAVQAWRARCGNGEGWRGGREGGGGGGGGSGGRSKTSQDVCRRLE